jgi:hypothetical protein
MVGERRPLAGAEELLNPDLEAEAVDLFAGGFAGVPGVGERKEAAEVGLAESADVFGQELGENVGAADFFTVARDGEGGGGPESLKSSLAPEETDIGFDLGGEIVFPAAGGHLGNAFVEPEWEPKRADVGMDQLVGNNLADAAKGGEGDVNLPFVTNAASVGFIRAVVVAIVTDVLTIGELAVESEDGELAELGRAGARAERGFDFLLRLFNDVEQPVFVLG